MKRLFAFFSALIILIFVSGCNGVNIIDSEINSSSDESILSLHETNSEAETETSKDASAENSVSTNADTNNTVTPVELIDLEGSAVQLIGAYIDAGNRVCFDMGSWCELKDYDLFREYFFGIWDTDSADLCSLWQKESPIVIDDSEKSALAEYGDFHFTNAYKVSDNVLAFVMNTIGNGLIFWVETNSPNTIYALAIVWTGDLTGLLCLGNMEEEYLLIKTDASLNEPSNGFLSVFKLHEMAHEHNIDFDLLTNFDCGFVNGEHILHNATYDFYPMYLVSEADDKIVLRTSVGNIGAADLKPIDVLCTFEKEYGEWVRTVEFDYTSISQPDDFIENLNKIIDSSPNIEELNLNLESIDTGNRISKIRAYESPNAFADNIQSSDGDFNMGYIIQINYDNEKNYITSWGEREANPIPMMFSCIIARSDTIEQLIAEMEGYNLGLGKEQRLTNISVYESYEGALSLSDDPIEVIMEHGKWVITEGSWKNEGAIRVIYENGESWFCLQSKGEII